MSPLSDTAFIGLLTLGVILLLVGLIGKVLLGV